MKKIKVAVEGEEHELNSLRVRTQDLGVKRIGRTFLRYQRPAFVWHSNVPSYKMWRYVFKFPEKNLVKFHTEFIICMYEFEIRMVMRQIK